MSGRTFATMLLLILLALTVAPLALAADPGVPVGGCPDGFALHPAGEHDHQNHDQNIPHQHIGLNSDLNGDGFWCVKHVGADQHLHVHIDNAATLP